MNGLNELREQGRMTWIEREHGWLAAPEEMYGESLAGAVSGAAVSR